MAIECGLSENRDEEMGKRDELIELNAADQRDKRGRPRQGPLTKAAVGLGPAIYREDSSSVAGGEPSELATIRSNFLVKKLGPPDGPELDAGIARAVETYGRGNRNKPPAVI
jgi:hypothetical protein